MSNSIYYVLGTFLNAGIPFLFLPILTRVLSPEEYGALTLYMSIYALSVPIVSIAIPQYAFRLYFDSKKEFERKISNAISTMFVWVAFLFIVLLTISLILVLQGFFSIEDAAVVVVIYLSAILNVFYQIRILLLNAAGKASNFVVNQLLYTSVIFSITIFSLFLIKSGVYSRIIGTLVSDCVFALYALKKIKSDFSIRINFSKYGLFDKEYLLFGFGLVPHLIASVLLSSVDKFIIGYSLTLEDLAGYAIAVQFTSVLMIFTQGVSKEWSRFYLKNRDNNETLKRGLGVMLTIVVLSFIMYWSQSIFFYFFVGDDYMINDSVIILLLIGQVFHCLYMILCVEISYTKKTHVLSSMTLMSLGINVLVSLTFVGTYGVIGVAIGTAAGMAIKFLAVGLFVRRSRKFN